MLGALSELYGFDMGRDGGGVFLTDTASGPVTWRRWQCTDDRACVQQLYTGRCKLVESLATLKRKRFTNCPLDCVLLGLSL
jgi:hypothetical protein